MNVRYFAQASGPGLSGRDVHEAVMAVEDLPPNAQRVIREDGLDAALRDFHYWEFDGMTLWWWVRPA